MEDSFDFALKRFYEDFGTSRHMVLSTALSNKPSSRMMSIVRIGDVFYFQTDMNFRKYACLIENPYCSLCIDNMQMEGLCMEKGHPFDNPDFMSVYEKSFPSSFSRYSSLKCERVFSFIPSFLELYSYLDGKPYIEVFCIKKKLYRKIPYDGAIGFSYGDVL